MWMNRQYMQRLWSYNVMSVCNDIEYTLIKSVQTYLWLHHTKIWNNLILELSRQWQKGRLIWWFNYYYYFFWLFIFKFCSIKCVKFTDFTLSRFSVSHTQTQGTWYWLSPPGQVKIDGSSHLAERKEELTAEGPKREKGGHEEWDLEL